MQAFVAIAKDAIDDPIERAVVVTTGQTLLRATVEEMLESVPDRSRVTLDEMPGNFSITLAGSTMHFDASLRASELALERLASAIEAQIAHDRAVTMLAASGSCGSNQVPLWLVAGSDVLARWLTWAKMDDALRGSLRLSDQADSAPVAGYLDRRSRREIGQGAARIRVSGSIAVAQRIELVGELRCNAMLGNKARIRIEGNPLPETIIAALSEDSSSGDPRPLADVIDHPFFAESQFRIVEIRNEGGGVMIDVESRCVSFAPIPTAAVAAMPAGAEPICPWRATATERSALYALVDRGRNLIAQ